MSKPDVNFTIGADGSAFAGAMGKLQEPLNKIGQAFIGLQGIAAGVQTAMTAMMVPVQAFGELEKAQVQMGIMLGSAEASARLTESLQSMATNGVVSMQDLVDSAAALSAEFKDPAELAEWVGRLADIGSVARITTPQLAGYYAQVLASGEVTARAVDTLAKQGVPVYEALAQTMRTSTEGVKAALAQGAISVEDYTAALVRMTSAGGAYYQMNEQMSGTTLGSIDTMKAQWQELLAEVGKPLALGITPVLKEVTAVLKSLKPYVAEVFGVIFQAGDRLDAWVLGVLPELAGSLVSVMKSLRTIAEPLMTIQKNVAQLGLVALGAALQVLAPLLDAVAAVVQALAPLVQLLCIPTEAFTVFVVKLSAVLKPLVKGFEVGVRVLARFIEGIAECVKWIPQSVREMLRLNEATEKVLTREEIARAAADARAKAEERKAAALRRSAEASERAAEANAVFEEHYKKMAVDDANALKAPQLRRRELLKVHGVRDDRDLSAQVGAILSEKDPTRERIERLRELLQLEATLTKMQRDAAKAAADAAKEEAEAQRKAYADYLARRDAEREAAWEKNATLAEKRAWYFGAGSVQMTPGEVSVAQVRKDMDALANEDPVKYAGMIADMEKWIAKVRELEDAEAAEAARGREAPNSARVSVVQASLAAVGGGGASIRIGDKQFREAQQQTKLLSAIKEALTNGPQVKELLAVLA